MRRQVSRLMRLPGGHLVLRLLACLVVLVAASTMAPGKAQANVTCGVTSAQSMAFGNSSTTSGTVEWQCTNYGDPAQPITLCLGMGTPSYPGTVSPFQPIMQNATGTSTLNYDFYKDPAFSERWDQSNPFLTPGVVPPGNPATVTGRFDFYARIPSGQTPASGEYTADIFNMVLGFQNGAGMCVSSGVSDFSGVEFTLHVTSDIQAACTVRALGDADLGAVPATATNVSGSTTIEVTCPTGTPYYVGLQPSNGDMAGAGVLTGTGGNSDQPTYQLRSQIGPDGTIWGNTATATDVGNGVSGTGTGTAQGLPVYVTVPSVNFRPDVYSDTVTVNVNY